MGNSAEQEDPYEEWYGERSWLSAGTLLEREIEDQKMQRRQREMDEEYYQRSLPREEMPTLKPLGGAGASQQRKRSAAGDLDGGKRSRQ